MRALIFGLNYPPEFTSIGPYTADLAEFLASQGHEVQVITAFPSAPHWKIWSEYDGRWTLSETFRNVKVRRTYIYVPSNPRSAFRRILFDMSFSVSGLVGSLWSGPIDIVLVISPPLQLGIVGWILSRFRGAPLMLHIQDIVSEAAVATGLLSQNSMSARVARQLERFIYKKAAGIGVICEGFKRSVLNTGTPPGKIHLLPNYIDLDFIQPCKRDNEFRRQHGLAPSDFVVMYSGSVSTKQGLEVLVEAARFIIDPEIKILIIGDGARLEEVRARALYWNLARVRFLPLQPRENLPTQLGAADLLAITQRPSVKDMVFPGKLIYYLAAQRPILAVVNPDSETGRFVEHERVGTVVPPDNPANVAATIARLKAEDLTEAGCKARFVAQQRFDRNVVLPQFQQLLKDLIAD